MVTSSAQLKNLKEYSHPNIILNEVFHSALLTCCCFCVIKAVGATQKLHPSPNLHALQIFSILHITESNPYDYLKVSESFYRALSRETARGKLGSPLIFALPRILQRDVKQTDVQITDSLLWCSDLKFSDSLPEKIQEFQTNSIRDDSSSEDNVCFWPPEVLAPTLREEIENLVGNSEEQQESRKYPTPEHEDYAEYRTVSYLVRKVLTAAYVRIQGLCKVLDVPPQLPVANQVWVTFRFLLRNHISLLYDRHVDQWILCSFYGATKMMKYKPEITFARIINAYVSMRGQELGDVTCQRIIRHIKISKNNVANVITLYNKVFVPSMSNYLLKSKSLKRCTTELAELALAGREHYAAVDNRRSADRGVPIEAAVSGENQTRTIIHFGKPDTTKMASQANEISSSRTIARDGMEEQSDEKGNNGGDQKLPGEETGLSPQKITDMDVDDDVHVDDEKKPVRETIL